MVVVPHSIPISVTTVVACRLFLLWSFIHSVFMLLLPKLLRKYLIPSRGKPASATAAAPLAESNPARPAVILPQQQKAEQGKHLFAHRLQSFFWQLHCSGHYVEEVLDAQR